MADDNDKVAGASGETSFADRGDGGGSAAGNVPASSGDTAAPVPHDPFAYRNAGDNGRRRAEHMERVVIDNFYGGSSRRFDEDAGVDFDA